MFMKISIRRLRWVFLALYLAVIVTLLGLWFAREKHDRWLILLMVAIFFATQIIFIFGAGTIELCRPIKKRRLLIPVIVASLMGAILVGGILIAFSELFKLEERGWAIEYIFCVILAIGWAAWGFLFHVHCQRVDRYSALKRMTLWLLGGSLVELLGSVPSHIIVSRRPGCLVGLGTMIGIIAGVYVMLWAFGPGIILLFLRDRHALQKIRNDSDSAPGL
jgi:hypothetical protein